MQQTKALGDELATLLVILLTVEIVVGFFGNLKVCLILRRRRELRKVPHILLGQLSFAGLVTNATFTPALLTAVLQEQFFDYPSPTPLCTARYSSSLFCIILESLTLVAMAMDRHDCVCKPFKRHLTPANVKKVVMTTWIVAVALTAVHAPLAYRDMKDGCMVYGFRLFVSARYIMIVTNILMTLTLLSILFTMFRVVRKLRSSQFPSQSNQRAERRVTKLSFGIMGAYSVSLLPLIVFSIVASAIGLRGNAVKGGKLFVLAFSKFSFVVNPFLHAEICKVEPAVQHSGGAPHGGRARLERLQEETGSSTATFRGLMHNKNNMNNGSNNNNDNHNDNMNNGSNNNDNHNDNINNGSSNTSGNHNDNRNNGSNNTSGNHNDNRNMNNGSNNNNDDHNDNSNMNNGSNNNMNNEDNNNDNNLNNDENNNDNNLNNDENNDNSDTTT